MYILRKIDFKFLTKNSLKQKKEINKTRKIDFAGNFPGGNFPAEHFSVE